MHPTTTTIPTKAVAVPASSIYTRPNSLDDNPLGFDHYKTPIPNVFIRPHSQPIASTYLQPSSSGHRIAIPSTAIQTPLENSDDLYKPIAAYAPSSTPAPFGKDYGTPIAAYDPGSGFSTTTISPIDNNDGGYSSTPSPPLRRYRPNGGISSTTNRPYDLSDNSLEQRDRYNNNGGYGYKSPYNQIGNGYDKQFPLYDGVSQTGNGFRYYLPRQYHEEDNSDPNDRAGSYGYIDPFGIRRVVYYNASPRGGFQFRKNNRYVGFNATPYDPRPL